jgi:hypothetical protein
MFRANYPSMPIDIIRTPSHPGEWIDSCCLRENRGKTALVCLCNFRPTPQPPYGHDRYAVMMTVIVSISSDENHDAAAAAAAAGDDVYIFNQVISA